MAKERQAPVEEIVGVLQRAGEQPVYTMRDIADELDVSKETIRRRMGDVVEVEGVQKDQIGKTNVYWWEAEAGPEPTPPPGGGGGGRPPEPEEPREEPETESEPEEEGEGEELRAKADLPFDLRSLFATLLLASGVGVLTVRVGGETAALIAASGVILSASVVGALAESSYQPATTEATPVERLAGATTVLVGGLFGAVGALSLVAASSLTGVAQTGVVVFGAGFILLAPLCIGVATLAQLSLGVGVGGRIGDVTGWAK